MSSSKYLNKGHLKQRQISEAKILGNRILGLMPDVLRRHRISSEVVKRTMLRCKPSTGAKNGDTEIDQKNARCSKCLKLAFSWFLRLILTSQSERGSFVSTKNNRSGFKTFGVTIHWNNKEWE
ncbi:hypothetical protein TNCV_4501261 [Trichonephila clavipes]|nr:hypothetical protein TNCV_4501261 [Trichonephila clavipes]